MINKKKSYVIDTFFFFSGISGLIYEVVWARLLAQVFGSTVYATSTILVAYMTGLSVGSYFGGRLAERLKNPVKFYGFCEFGIGVFALLFPVLFNLVNAFYIDIYNIFTPFQFSLRHLFTAIRFIVISSLLIIPTSLMGATLPALCRGLFSERNRTLNFPGFLYALNTAGAVCGVVFSAFVGIEKLGLRTTSYVAASINITIAFLVLFILNIKSLKTEDRIVKIIRFRPSSINARLVLFVFSISGFCAMSLEVLWTRELVFFLGIDSYAFGTMLSVFLFGIGLGSFIISRSSGKIKNPFLLLGIFEACIGITTLLNFILIPKLYQYKQSLFANLGYNIFSFVFSGYTVTLALMTIPTLFMGGAFPLAAKVYSENTEKIGHAVGKIYSFNTLGSIIGSTLTGFLFVPLLGISSTFKVIISVNILIGTIILLFANYRNRVFRIVPAAFAVLTVVVALLLPLDNPLVVFSYIMDDPDVKLLHYSEDEYASVSVVEIPGVGRRLYVDSGLAADTSRFDMPSHKLIVHVPLLIQKAPQNALVIGFGMGETSHSITTHGVMVEAVEISRGAVDANKYFLDVNHDILNNPLFHLTLDDGRSFLLKNREKYDLISVGIIHPGISSGSAGFYGLDFYKLCVRALTDDGIISQWVPTHGLSLEAFKTIIKTFIAVFPHSTLWFKYTDNFVILLGSRKPFSVDYKDFLDKFHKQEVLNDLETVDMTNPVVLLDSFWMGEKELAEFVKDSGITSDDHPALEFMSIKSVNNIGTEIIRAISPKHEKITGYLTNIDNRDEVEEELNIVYNATEHLIRGHISKKMFLFEMAIFEFEKAIEMYPHDENAKFLLRHTEDIYFNILLINAEERFKENKITEALSLYKKALLIKPQSAMAHNLLGTCYSRIGEYGRAIVSVKNALERDPDNFQYHFNFASLLALTGDYYSSKEELEKALMLNPGFKKAEDALLELNKFLKNE
jgi:spermidine synthase